MMSKRKQADPKKNVACISCRHRRSNKHVSAFECNICFNQSQYLVPTCDTGQHYSCWSCVQKMLLMINTERFDHRTLQFRHHQDDQRTPTTLCCPSCRQQNDITDNVSIHRAFYHKCPHIPKPRVCAVCSRSFRDMQMTDAIMHMATCRVLMCPGCDAVFSSIDDANTHVLKHCKRLRCVLCQEKGELVAQGPRPLMMAHMFTHEHRDECVDNVVARIDQRVRNTVTLDILHDVMENTAAYIPVWANMPHNQ